MAIGFPVPYFALELARARMAPGKFPLAVTHAGVFSPSEAVDVGFYDEVVTGGEDAEDAEGAGKAGGAGGAGGAALERACAQAALLGGHVKHPAYVDTKMRERGAMVDFIRSSLAEDVRAFSEAGSK